MCTNNQPYYAFSDDLGFTSKLNYNNLNNCVEEAKKTAKNNSAYISVYKLYGFEDFIEDGHLECVITPDGTIN